MFIGGGKMNYNVKLKRLRLKKCKTNKEIDQLLEEIYADGFDDGCIFMEEE